MKHGKVDKYIFDGGYAQASVASTTTDNFAFYFYNQDHLGNNREVVDAGGNIQQVTNYYPFGATYFDDSAVKSSDYQPYKFNGKEFDKMYGLNTYDYGARMYDGLRFTTMDPLCEKNPSVTPYHFCHNNPVNNLDPDGKDDYRLNKDGNLEFWRKSNAKTTDRIYSFDKKNNITRNKITT